MKAHKPSFIGEPQAEPTVLMPAPGGQATVIMKRPAGPANASANASANATLELQRLVAGINPLVGAAATLLALVAQLRRTASHTHPAALRQQLLERMADFEAQAAAGGTPRPKITAARYLLCAFIDETIEQTPWGAGGPWAERNLLQTFHEERWGGDKAFQLLERLGQEPQANADLLELFYVCLRLGFEGRYRGTSKGREQLDALAARVLEVIRPPTVAASARGLALNWRGVAGMARRDRRLPSPWVLLALAAALPLGIFLAFNARLDELARPVFRQIVALPAALRIERNEASILPRIAPLLQAEAASGALQVRDEAQRSVVTLGADSLFLPGSAQLEAHAAASLARVGQALKDSPGQIAVIGHTDDAPVRSPQFPSQWHLSNERARAVLAALAHAGIAPTRLRAEGRADAEPLLPNTDAAARARNRRIEIELRPPRPNG